MASTLHSSWELLFLRGILAIIFAVFTWQQPIISFTALLLFFTCYSFLDGFFSLWIAIAGHKVNDSWWILLLKGILGILIGLITFYSPKVTEMALLFYIAIWAVSTGVLEILAGIRLRHVIVGEWMLILLGLISVLLGILLMCNPFLGVLTLVWIVTYFAFMYGVLLVAFSIKTSRFNKGLHHISLKI